MKTIGLAQFKEKCLSLLSHLSREGLVITKHGKPIAKVSPIATESSALIGKYKGRVRIKGDILSTGIKWDAES